jgi:galactosyl transferase GMA12/MNN10 family
MTRALCTLAVDAHVELLDLALPTFREFGERHGYEVIVHREVAGKLAPSWAKVRLLRELLEAHDEVVWVDADAMIVDASRDIFEDMPADRSWGWVMHISGNTLLPNAGMLALRSRPAAFEILDGALALSERYATHPWWEQAAINELLGFAEIRSSNSLRLASPTRLMTSVEFLGTEWNSIAIDQAPAPRIKHYAGLSSDLRLEAMAWDLAALAKRGRPPAYDVAIVLHLHGAGEHDVLRCLEAIAGLGDDISTQTVIVAPPQGPLDHVFSALEGDVRIVRSRGAPDHALVGGLSAADGRLLLISAGPFLIGHEALRRLLGMIDDPAGGAVMVRTELFHLIAVRADALPVTAWVGGAPGVSAEAPLTSALRALTGAGVAVAGLGG